MSRGFTRPFPGLNVGSLSVFDLDEDFGVEEVEAEDDGEENYDDEDDHDVGDDDEVDDLYDVKEAGDTQTRGVAGHVGVVNVLARAPYNDTAYSGFLGLYRIIVLSLPCSATTCSSTSAKKNGIVRVGGLSAIMSA